VQKIELYIQGQRVELFKDESVTITDSIQNVRDIEKVFTAFTKSFSIPASKTNNKIFKHYYNYDIVGGFDARKKVIAFIELNSIPFKTGKVKLEGVDMKNNKAHTYRITFFGDIVELKDELGEAKLSDLNFPTSLDLNYDATTIESKLIASESGTDIIAPLITHSQRLFYEAGTHGQDTGNLWYEQGSGLSYHHGVKFNELKYAIRVNRIIQQIETDYPALEFSNDFFKNTGITEFDHLFLWLHRKSGAVEDLSGTTTKSENHIDWNTLQSNGFFSISFTSFYSFYAADDPLLTVLRLVIDVISTDPFDIRIERGGVPVYTKTDHTGDITISGLGATPDFFYAPGQYEVYITAATAIQFTKIEWEGVYDNGGSQQAFADYSTGSFTTSATFLFNISKQMPDIKIIDFLTGLFKLFNLTAFVDNGVIKVKTLDNFYANAPSIDPPPSYDITEFVDVESSTVDVALPYKEIEFKFKDTKTFLANKFGELNNREWGSIKYSADETDLSGQLYKVEVPFGHLLYERLNDAGTGAQKNIQWGFNVDKSQNAYLGSPLLFYPILTNTGGISFIDQVNSSNVATSHKRITNVNLPSNSPSQYSATNNNQLNFGLETNEWTQDSTFTDTLFLEYYEQYIASVFNTKQRLTKVKAYLPLRILLNYNLSDRFVIAGNSYKINSVSTNLLTGESNIELLTDL
tara:strand:- start:353 stop:2425 length:2073 start_codon:yes stop_codon:yes gene_type:complete